MDYTDHDLEEEVYKNHLTCDLAGVGTAAGLQIQVFTNEKDCLPHFHYTSIDGSIKGCIRLDKAEYFSHENEITPLERPRLRQLIVFLKSQSAVFKLNGFCIWDFICAVWDMCGSTIKVGKIEMPDYSTLETKDTL